MAKRTEEDIKARQESDANLQIFNDDGTLYGEIIDGEWIPAHPKIPGEE